MKGLFLFIGVIVTVVVGSIWGGYVLSILWGWFIVPTFHLPQISIALAIGIELVVRSVTYTSTSSQQQDSKKSESAALSYMGITFVYPLLLLIVGAVAHHFV